MSAIAIKLFNLFICLLKVSLFLWRLNTMYSFMIPFCPHPGQSSFPLGLSEFLLKVECVAFWEKEASQDQRMVSLERKLDNLLIPT